MALAFPLKASGSIEQKRVKLGDPVTLRCNISLHHEIFWLRVSMMEKPRIIMVSRLKNDGELTEVLNYDRTHYEGCLMDRFFGLRIFSVLISDLGSYYCGIVEGKRMEFEDGVHLHGNIALKICKWLLHNFFCIIFYLYYLSRHEREKSL